MKENGRTLLEMMGVVTVLGVIAVGAISGASVLTRFYQAHATAMDIEQTAVRARDLYDYSCSILLQGNELLCKQDVFAQGCFDKMPLHRWGGSIYFDLKTTASMECENFTITYTNVPKHACVQLCGALGETFEINKCGVDTNSCSETNDMVFTPLI